LTPACSCGGAVNGNEGIYGNWLYNDADAYLGYGYGLTLGTDGTYELTDMSFWQSCPGSVAAQVETGTFAVNAGTITFTPQQWSCTGYLPCTPDGEPVRSSTYALASPRVLSWKDRWLSSVRRT